MKKTYLLLNLMFFVPLIFGPFLFSQNSGYSLFYGVFDGVFSIYNVLCILEIVIPIIIIFTLRFPKIRILNLILSICFLSLLFFNASVFENVKQTTSQIGPSFILLVIYSLYLFLKSLILVNNNISFNIKDIVEIGLFVAIGLSLDIFNIKIRIGSNGGSISFTMIPLIILCLRKGFYKGFIACGLIFGLLNCIFDGFGLVTFPLDYLLAFGSISIVGIFKKYIIPKDFRFKIKGLLFLILSIFVACLSRLIFATLSGIIIWGLTFLPSLIYQISYIAPSFIISLVLMVILYKPILLIEKRFPSTNNYTLSN